MPKIIKNIPQGSDEWLKLRCGIVTASCMSKVLSKGEGKTRKAYMMQIAAEMMTGEPQETYTNKSMEWGTEVEPQARSYYELETGLDVEEVTIILNDHAGYSPDCLVNNDGLVEIKCPNTTTHLEYLLANKVPAKYKAQIQTGLWVSEREWCDFISFDPRIKGPKKYFCKRQHRDDDYIRNIETETKRFNDELGELVEKLRA